MPYLQKINRAQPATASERQQLAPSIAHTIEAWTKLTVPTPDDGVAKIEVHHTISNVAWAYEKLRQAIDYQDEHLLRKNAIERILKRRLVAGVTAEQIAEPLVTELIRGRYLLNNDVPVTMIDQVAALVNRYIHLWSQVPTDPDPRETSRLYHWYIGLLAVELNELLAPATHDDLLVRLMLHIAQRDVFVDQQTMDLAEKNTQLFVAIHRALLKSDATIIRYHLFLRLHPNWPDATIDAIPQLGAGLPDTRRRIENQLLHPAGELMQRLMKKYTIIFHIFDDLFEKHGPRTLDILTQPDELEKEVKEAYDKRRKGVTRRITRNVIRSIIYVFLTKMVLTLLLEVPIDRLFVGPNMDYTPLIINTVFPPLLLLFIGVTIRPPGPKNERAVIDNVRALVYRADSEHALIKPRKPIRRSYIFSLIYRIFYGLMFFIVFGGIITLLTRFGFTPISTFIFLLFLSLVSFFGIRVRLLAKELVVVDQRENIVTVIFDFLTVPILQVGRWLSLRAPKINVFIFFLDVIIEAPFKAFLEATEGFLGFLREKREEIY